MTPNDQAIVQPISLCRFFLYHENSRREEEEEWEYFVIRVLMGVCSQRPDERKRNAPALEPQTELHTAVGTLFSSDRSHGYSAPVKPVLGIFLILTAENTGNQNEGTTEEKLHNCQPNDGWAHHQTTAVQTTHDRQSQASRLSRSWKTMHTIRSIIGWAWGVRNEKAYISAFVLYYGRRVREGSWKIRRRP